jgi:HPt (histidine-containing phosphotransfer) domain-containing protein
MSSPSVEAVDKACQDGGRENTESESVLDEAHLARMTLGDQGLEWEVLQIFARQAAMIVGRLDEAAPRSIAIAAHTLLGSARGVGAWRVARAAERVEWASNQGGGEKLNAAIAELKAASLEAGVVIGARLSEKP